VGKSWVFTCSSFNFETTLTTRCQALKSAKLGPKYDVFPLFIAQPPWIVVAWTLVFYQIGDDHTETGYLRVSHVRIPRTWMLMKNQHVTEDGKYVKNVKAGESKTMYSTMLAIRAGLVGGAGSVRLFSVCKRRSCLDD
jgi:hypothetical protein